jgi:hypothetical protein
VCDFIADLLRGGTSAKEVKKLVNSNYGKNSIKIRAIYKILRQIKDSKTTKD